MYVDGGPFSLLSATCTKLCTLYIFWISLQIVMFTLKIDPRIWLNCHATFEWAKSWILAQIAWTEAWGVRFVYVRISHIIGFAVDSVDLLLNAEFDLNLLGTPIPPFRQLWYACALRVSHLNANYLIFSRSLSNAFSPNAEKQFTFTQSNLDVFIVCRSKLLTDTTATILSNGFFSQPPPVVSVRNYRFY